MVLLHIESRYALCSIEVLLDPVWPHPVMTQLSPAKFPSDGVARLIAWRLVLVATAAKPITATSFGYPGAFPSYAGCYKRIIETYVCPLVEDNINESIASLGLTLMRTMDLTRDRGQGRSFICTNRRQTAGVWNWWWHIQCMWMYILYTPCLIKNCAKFFMSELRQFSINFYNFW